MPTLQEITDGIRTAVASEPALGKTLKLDFKGEGVVYVDGASVSNEDKAADLTVTADKSDFEALGAGRLDPMTAVMTGKLKLSDMGLAMQLQPKLQGLFSKIG